MSCLNRALNNPKPPTLIQRVNTAAAQHPWLTVIIHKAARSSASKEELAKLGRVVARLGRGEGVGEGPDEGLPTPIAEPSTSFSPPAGHPVRSTAGADDSSDSDSEADMTGPKQVGGGSIPPKITPVSGSTVSPALGSTPARPPGASSSTATPSHQAEPTTAFKSGAASTNPKSKLNHRPTPYTPSPLITLAPPRRPTYPLPLPFLLVAFREAPTEKFLLPLGSQSFVSRVGADYVTSPPPVEKKADPIQVSVAPATAPEPIPASPAVPDTAALVTSGRGRGRTRASLGRTKQEAPAVVAEPELEPEAEQLVEESKSTPRRSDLPILAGMKPVDGTVLLSTMIPADGWVKSDWVKLGERLPFGKTVTRVKQEPSASIPSDQPTPTTPYNQNGRPASSVDQSSLSNPLNLAAESLLPDEGDLHAVTIRLNDVDDRAWRRMKSVMEEVERVDMVSLGEAEPELLVIEYTSAPTPGIQTGEAPGIASVPASQAVLPSAPRPGPTKITPLLRSTYIQRKRSRFQALLRRIPPRPFLRYRLPSPLPSLVEATSDKWALRPYPISTKPTDETDLPLPAPTPSSPEMSKKKRRKEEEPEVTFEMPVSLDALAERVAEGARKGLGKKGRGRGVGTDENGRRTHAKRSLPGRICEGCGKEGRKVWRRGPGGKGTRESRCFAWIPEKR